MKLGGLFSGIGGFELAWTRLGGEVAWMCEWDKNARKVLEARFPGVPIYPDVRDLDPAEVEAVDVLTGGSPCQGFSVAGQRQGLLHGESRLFADYVRIMDGLAQRGLQYALWENVPGVLSIKNPDGERTFPHVIGALAGGSAAVRLDPRRKWNVGLVANGERAVAWRVLDSRYFGVAQRRRRVFACVAFGDSASDRAGRALLAVAEGVRGDSAAGVEAGQGAAEGVAGGVGGPIGVAHTLTGNGFDASEDGTGRGTPVVPDRAGIPCGYRMTAFGQYEDDDTASTLKQRDHKDATDLVAYGMYGGSGQEGATIEEQPAITASHGQPGNVAQPAVLMTMREGKPGGGKGPLLVEEEPLTLATGNGQTLFQPQAFDEMNFTTDDETHHVLRAGTKQSTGVLEPYGFSAGNSQHARSMGEEQGVAPPIRAGASGTNQSPTVGPVHVGDTRTTHAIVEPTPILEVTARQGTNPATSSVGIGEPGDPMFTLQASKQHGVAEAVTYGVRRLTPVECERLQAFPDGWTEPAGSDSARYKALGNAVTVNTVGWILKRMKEIP